MLYIQHAHAARRVNGSAIQKIRQNGRIDPVRRPQVGQPHPLFKRQRVPGNPQESFLITVIERIFGVSSAKRDKTPKTDLPVKLDPIREHFYSAMRDCADSRAERMAYKIKVARTASELWLLRSDLHLCISQTHSQSVAAERINALIPAFKGLLPASQLSRI